MEIKELMAQVDKGFEEMKSLAEKQAEDIKKHGAVTAETEKEAKALKEKMDAVEKSLSEVNPAEIKAYEERITALEVKANRPGAEHQEVVKSLGLSFVESKSFAALEGANTPTFTMDTKDISSGGASAGALSVSYRDPNVYMDPEYPTVRGLFKSVPVQDGSVDITRELAFTNNAAMQTAELAAYAKSELTYSIENLPVRTIGHHVISSRQILSDAPRLAALIDSRLRYGIARKVDAQILYGDGTGTNLTGLFVDTSVSNLGEFTLGTTVTPTLMIEKVRTAITTCANFGYMPNAVLVNPADWETMELGKGTDGHYIFATVGSGAEAKMWNVRVVATTDVAADDFMVGDFNMGATIYDRQQSSVRTSESHANLFIENGVAIVGDERLTLGIELPHAFCKGQFSVAVA